ncbi:MAG: heavy metal-associated domain-containing protein [Halobacteria archaeon]|nr:heavy metal-associated domain-containing protein [Halobacteria archaeon]
MTVTVTVKGMSEGCEETVEDALKGVEGVETASADRETGKVTVEGSGIDSNALVKAVEEAGYEAEV